MGKLPKLETDQFRHFPQTIYQNKLQLIEELNMKKKKKIKPINPPEGEKKDFEFFNKKNIFNVQKHKYIPKRNRSTNF